MGDWILYSIDSNANGYYQSNLMYFYQITSNETNIDFISLGIAQQSRLWSIADYISDPFPSAFCIMNNENESIDRCNDWYFFNDTEYILVNYEILSSECPSFTSDLCVYGLEFSDVFFIHKYKHCFQKRF